MVDDVFNFVQQCLGKVKDPFGCIQHDVGCGENIFVLILGDTFTKQLTAGYLTDCLI